jgi:hypothetical protein
MEDIFMTDTGIVRRLSIRYGNGELISPDFRIDPETGELMSLPPHWHTELRRMAESDNVEVKVEYWLENSHGKRPPLRDYVTEGFDSQPAWNDELFAVIIPLHHPRHYLKTDDLSSPTQIRMQSLDFQLDIHNRNNKRRPACQTEVNLHLATAHLELLG